MKDVGLNNLQAASALLEGLVAAGLEQVVISPGSRSTPLTLAATGQPRLGWQVVLDERCAAFMALGMAKIARRPVALIATSGSAPGNWWPAVMEASESGVPLILLSADRPWELQQCGANQTTDQLKLFGDRVRSFHQLAEAEEGGRSRLRALGRQLMLESQWPQPGPVHLNFPFREPLVPVEMPAASGEVEIRPTVLPQVEPPRDLLEQLITRFPEGPGLLICGDGYDERLPIIELAEKLGVPLLADPLSDLRFPGVESPNIIATYSRFLESAETRQTLKPDWILQFGAMPVSGPLREALKQWCVASHWLVDPRGSWIDPLDLGVEVLPVQTAPLCNALLASPLTREEPQWLYRWRHRERSDARSVPVEGALLSTLLDNLPDESLLFCGNSLPIRWLDAWSGSGRKRIAIRGNRGLSGIDGNLSTFLGMAREWGGSGRRVALLGDLTFQHDLGGLANAGGCDVLVIVLNNGGGGIFDGLPQRMLPHYEACWRTPQNIDLSHLAGLFGVGFQRVKEVDGFQKALDRAQEGAGVQVVEVMLSGMRV